MKKAAIIICAAIYALSIIVIAFLGYKAEIKNPPIYADDIVMSYEVPYQCVQNGAVVYEVTNSAPPKKLIDEDAPTRTYKYDVRIFDFEYFYMVFGGVINVSCKPISYQVDENNNPKVPDELGLNYSISDKTIAKVSTDGIVTFNEGLNVMEYTLGSLDLIVKTRDTSNITIHLQIYWL